MQEAFGGILSIVLIVVFLLIVEGVLGFTVSYTKAFKMKNAVISAIEQYDAAGCFTKDTGKSCYNEIKASAVHYGYSPARISCPTGFNLAFDNGESFFCYRKNDNTPRRTYHIITQVDINIPIINNIMGFSIFQVSGDTRAVG